MLILKGKEVEDYIDQLGHFRIEIFREYPYFYDGSLEYEREYLSRYSRSQRSLVILMVDDQRIVGACTGIPLSQECEEFKEPFEGEDVDQYFYIGEIMLDKGYRGKGLGKKLFDDYLSHIPKDRYQSLCAYTVRRVNPSNTEDDSPIKGLLVSRGFKVLKSKTAYFSWKDVGHTEETIKAFDVWTCSR